MTRNHPEVSLPGDCPQLMRQKGFVVAEMGDIGLHINLLEQALMQMKRSDFLQARLLRDLESERDAEKRLVDPGLRHNPASGRWSFTCIQKPEGLDMGGAQECSELGDFWRACMFLCDLARSIGMSIGEKFGSEIGRTRNPALADLIPRADIALRVMEHAMIPGMDRNATEPSTSSLGILLYAAGGKVLMLGRDDTYTAEEAEQDTRKAIVMNGRELAALDPRYLPTYHKIEPGEGEMVGKPRFVIKAHINLPGRMTLPKTAAEKTLAELIAS